jgi:hypothetical protein
MPSNRSVKPTSSPFKIKEESTTTIDLDNSNGKEYKDLNDAYERAVNFLATAAVDSDVTITQQVRLKRVR